MPRRIPPAFTSDKARAAQRLALRSRRVNDERLRTELLSWLRVMSEPLRRRVVDALRQRTVDQLVAAARKERGQ
jgi:hypothetical protein